MLRTAGTALLAALFVPVSSFLAQQPRTPVVVELFTSEGCSSCPPADALLARMDRDQPVPNADIIILGEHVDYWDSLGWHDRFSSASFTQRQRNYQTFFNLDDVYTPQFVVNGSAQLNGSDPAAVSRAIENAAAQTVTLQFTGVEVHSKSGPESVNFTLSNAPATHPEYVRIYAALIDPTDTTVVRAGENKDRTLHHAGVVRAFAEVVGPLHMKDLGRHPDQPFSIQVHGALNLNGMRLVVFAQTKPIGPILAAASCVLSTSPAAAPNAAAPFPANRCPTAANIASGNSPESIPPHNHLK